LRAAACSRAAKSPLPPAAHRVDQVVGDVDALARAAQALGVERVADVLLVPRSDGRRTRQRTSTPSSASAAASRPPTNPVAPVTNAFTQGVRAAQ
jgi:hypothetical protein